MTAGGIYWHAHQQIGAQGQCGSRLSSGPVRDHAPIQLLEWQEAASCHSHAVARMTRWYLRMNQGLLAPTMPIMTGFNG
jgi:hypothetical protein